MTRTASVAIACLLVAHAASAQVPPGSSHAAAARELISVLELEKHTALNLAWVKGPLTADNPMAEKLTEVVVEFMAEVLPWDKIEPEYIKVYQTTFSEAEIRSLIAFYRTSVGQKLIEETPELTRRAAMVLQTMMLPHQSELQRRMLEAMGFGHVLEQE